MGFNSAFKGLIVQVPCKENLWTTNFVSSFGHFRR